MSINWGIINDKLKQLKSKMINHQDILFCEKFSWIECNKILWI